MKKTVETCVLGLGYIGLPLALLLAQNGARVYGFDVDSKKLQLLKNGVLPIKENGLPELFAAVNKKKNFQVVDSVPSVQNYIIAVPTPQRSGHSDLSYIFNCLELIRPHFQKDALIILESTIGPSDCETRIIPKIREWGVPFKFTHCPERAVPGSTLKEMVSNDRIIGGTTELASKAAKKLYKMFVTGNISLTTPNLAATAKTMENTFRAVNIALANEFAKIAEELNLDVWQAIELANHHPRVTIHQPGLGVGGHCIPVDPWFFVGESAQTELIKTALTINKKMPKLTAQKIVKLIKKHKLTKPIVGVLGYSYKKNVDDVRETPVQDLIAALQDKTTVLLHDPHLKKAATYQVIELKKLLETAQVIVLATDHDLYKEINFSMYKNIVFVYDTRNLFTQKNFSGAKAVLYKLGVG